MITLETELARIRGLGPNFISKLQKLKIETVQDLLWHFPFRYDDFSTIVKIADLKLNQSATVSGVIRKIDLRRTWRRKMLLVETIIVDDSGGIKAVWFNQPYIGKILRVGMRANLSGKVALTDKEIYLSNPSYEPLRGGEIKHTAGLIPVYPETRGLTSRGLRYLIKPILKVLPPIQDFLPAEILAAYRLPDLNTAIKKVHFPRVLTEAEQAKKRFAFEDLFLLQLNNLKLRSRLAQEKAPVIEWNEEGLKKIGGVLPFELTNSQKRSLAEILNDLKRGRPMNRLLQGDVGSGKTVIAAIAALLVAKSNLQAAFMAPTEVLARQHYQTLHKIFGNLLKQWGLEVGLLLGGLTQKLKKETAKKIATGEIKIIIGTHALIQKGVTFNNLGLIVVDEQHRFGVEQRANLGTRNQGLGTRTPLPHFLSMSATPIPRTLSLTLFGDLDLSIIDELPKGRKAIITKVVAPENRSKAYAFVREEIKKGRQVFVICPRIEVANSHETPTNATNISVISGRIGADSRLEMKAVKEEFEKLSEKVFPDLKVAMLHGKLKSKEKEKIMNDFKNRLTDILVSTSVIEVGVDIPNATIMIIEGVEHFGLAQLYQFRGRIGRGEHQSFCLLFTESNSQSVKERLDALLRAKNGFELAELDLQMRGPGEFLGEKQTGLPDLAMKALNNLELIKTAREAASRIIEKDGELKNYPLLKEKLETFQKAIHLE